VITREIDFSLGHEMKGKGTRDCRPGTVHLDYRETFEQDRLIHEIGDVTVVIMKYTPSLCAVRKPKRPIIGLLRVRSRCI